MIERYAFITESVWQSAQHIAPDAIELNGYRMVQYASPHDSDMLKSLLDGSGLELIHHSICTAQMIIDGIAAGDNKVFNCNHDVASAVIYELRGDDGRPTN